MTESSQHDVIVIGAGIAGLAAAVTGIEAGLDVVLLEKTPSIGGSSAMSGGFFAFSGTEEQAAEGVEDNADLFLKDMLDVGGHVNDPALLQAYLDHQDDLYRWLKKKNVTFGALEISSGQSAARSHNTKIKDLLAMLRDEFVSAGGTVLLEHRAMELVRDRSGSVSGVVADSPAGQILLTARDGIVLASGGFSRSGELLQIFAPAQLRAIPYGGIGNTGDGLKMAWKLGTGVADMGYVSATYGSHPETGMEFHELLTAYYMGAIIVNQDGKRFVDESRSYKILGTECLKQPDGLGFEVFDSVVRAKSHRGVPLNDIDMLEEIGHVHKAETLEDLAAIAGIDEGQLLETISRYNAAVSGTAQDEFGRTGLCNGIGELTPIEKAPFYAYPAKSLMTTTYCGITITPQAEVTDVDGQVIEGLYAAGEVTGGFHGAAYMTGTSLGKGALFGRVAGQQLAARHASATRVNGLVLNRMP